MSVMNSSAQQWSGAIRQRICSGYSLITWPRITLKPIKGSVWMDGFGWTNEIESFTQPSFVHSDCAIGNPSSLSDGRIKDSQVAIEPSNCLSFCNSLTPSLYLQTLSNEVGVA